MTPERRLSVLLAALATYVADRRRQVDAAKAAGDERAEAFFTRQADDAEALWTESEAAYYEMREPTE